MANCNTRVTALVPSAVIVQFVTPGAVVPQAPCSAIHSAEELYVLLFLEVRTKLSSTFETSAVLQKRNYREQKGVDSNVI